MPVKMRTQLLIGFQVRQLHLLVIIKKVISKTLRSIELNKRNLIEQIIFKKIKCKYEYLF